MDKDNKKDEFLEELDPYLKEKFESELAGVFEDMEQDQDLGKAVEQIFEQTDNLHEIQSKLILIVKGRLESSEKNDVALEVDEDMVAKDITELCRKLMKDINPEMEDELGRMSYKDRSYMLDVEAKKNFKKIMKNFAVYEVYKVMNPEKIAGETSKDNYRNNLARGGEKLAGKYEGGKESDLKEYGKAEVKNIKSQAFQIKKGGFDLGR